MKKLIALLLCFAMLTGLVGCGGGTPAESTPPATTVPPTTTEPVPAASEVYAEAAAKLAALQNVELDVTYIEEMTLGADTFKSTTRETVKLTGIGTDSFAAHTEGTCYSGTYYTETTETFLNGIAYTQVNSDCFKGEYTAEEYQSRLLPVVLIDETLYETVEQTTQKEFTFTGAEILESWCDNPYTILDTVTATAELDDNGVLNRYTYKAAYKQGAADVNISVTVRVKEAADGSAPAVPDRADSYILLDTPDAPKLMHMVLGYLIQANAISSTTTDVVAITAGGFSEAQQISFHAYGQVATQIFKSESLYQVSADGQSQTSTEEISYIDGIMTTIQDGGRPMTDSSVQPSAIEYFVDNLLYAQIPDTAAIEDYDLTVVGDTLLLEYTFDESAGEDTLSYISETYLGDPELIRDVSSGYETTANGGYIGIDLSTGMPLSAQMTYLCNHTVDGEDYVVTYTSQQKMQLGNLNTYEEITGELLPAEEPEEKATPVFYHVTGAEGEEMWLLGTIHVGDVRTQYLPQEIYDAFDASDALALEFESESYTAKLMEDEEALQAYISALMYTDGTTAEDHINDPELYEQMVALLKATGTLDTTMLVTKPVFLEQTIRSFFMSNGYRLSSDYGVDSQLEKRANEQEKEILSVESGEFQMDMLANLSDGLQVLMLREAIEYGQVAYNFGTEELFELWCSGDEAALAAYINDENSNDAELTEEEKLYYEEYNTTIGANRNDDMLEVAKGYLTSGKVVFYAVGLAHLLAEDGLVHTLRDAGYTVELVTFG